LSESAELSGAIYGVRLLELLKREKFETHLIISRAARLTLTYETAWICSISTWGSCADGKARG
jgi:3-polyprenyl-4-hydroxybenzoate decarboxylase